MKKICLNLLLFFTCSTFVSISQENESYDPFKIYTSDINQSIENNQYAEWNISGLVSGLSQKKIYKTELNDTLLYVASGPEWLNGFNSRFSAKNLIIIPSKSKKIKIKLEYAYCKVVDFDSESDFEFESKSKLSLKLRFRKKIESLKEVKFPLPASYEMTEDSRLSVLEANTPPSIVEFELIIPDFTDNVLIEIDSFDSKEHAFPSVALRQCEILIDGKRINEYVYDQTLPFTEDEIREIEKKSTDRFSVPKNINLIGIGESIHGCKEFHDENFKIIKNLILDENVRYFGFEVGMVDGYKINRYIQGEMQEDDIEEILLQMGGTFNNENNIELFRFMRDFNEKNMNNPVCVMGFDIHNFIEVKKEEEIFSQLLEFFLENQFIRQSLILFAESKKNKNTETVLPEIRNILSSSTEKSLTNTELYEHYFQSFLSEYMEQRSKKIQPYDLRMKRDSLMAKRVEFFYDLLPQNEKMVICGHLGHLKKSETDNPMRNRRTFSCGYYLSEKYKDSYFVLALYAGTGNIYSSFYKGYSNNLIEQVFPLSPPMGKSVEQLGMQINKPLFYLNDFEKIEDILDKIYYDRSIGNLYDALQFFPINIKEEIDALVFFQNVKEMAKKTAE